MFECMIVFNDGREPVKELIQWAEYKDGKLWITLANQWVFHCYPITDIKFFYMIQVGDYGFN